MSNNSALKIRIYPNNKQNSFLKKGCEYRFHYYKALALWWNETNDVCRKLYKEYCEKEIAKFYEYLKKDGAMTLKQLRRLSKLK